MNEKQLSSSPAVSSYYSAPVLNEHTQYAEDASTSFRYQEDYDETPAMMPPEETTASPHISPQNSMKEKKEDWKIKLLRVLTIAVLFVGYTAMYLAFSILPVTSTLIRDDLKIEADDFSLVMTIARAVRIVPKIFAGTFSDIAGGRMVFFIGQAVSGIATIVFALPLFSSSLWYLIVCFSIQQLATVYPYPALVKIAASWFHYKQIGKVMGILSLSYLFGDGIARFFLSFLIKYASGGGKQWRIIFWISGGTLALISILSLFLLRNSPKDYGYPEPPADPMNALGKEGNDSTFRRKHRYTGFFGKLMDLLQVLVETFVPIFKSLPFYFIIVWYMCLTWIRYVFNDWSAEYMTSHVKSSPSNAALATVAFPIAGGCASLLMGYINDRVSSVTRNVIMLASELILTLLLIGLWAMHNFVPFSETSHWSLSMLPLGLFSLIGFFCIGPFSLSGAMSVKFGGKKISATFSSLMDGFASTVMMLSGLVGGRLLKYKTPQNWNTLFLIVIAVAALLIVVTIGYIVIDIWDSKRRAAKAAAIEAIPAASLNDDESQPMLANKL